MKIELIVQQHAFFLCHVNIYSGMIVENYEIIV